MSYHGRYIYVLLTRKRATLVIDTSGISYGEPGTPIGKADA